MAINALIAERSDAVVIQRKERHFLPGLKARVSVPNI